MKKPSQFKRVLNRLKEKGYITRNECLGIYPAITRLGAIICSLNKKGYNITGADSEDGKDYIYTYHARKITKEVAEKYEEDGQIKVRLVEKEIYE